jgi:hypothetical protein
VTVQFETPIQDSTAWVEAEVSVMFRGLAYADERGPFGPEEFDIEIEFVSVWTESGVDIFETLDPRTRKAIEKEVEERAVP